VQRSTIPRQVKEMTASFSIMNATPDDRSGGLLAWQWKRYPPSHRNRTNLFVHALTAPVFVAGTLALALSPFVPSLGLGLGLGGLGAMLGVMFLQRRTHRAEEVQPAPFRGPLDVAQRIFVEQWFTFPRYVLSGEFARAVRGEPVRLH
jgi:hypothetical protein